MTICSAKIYNNFYSATKTDIFSYGMVLRMIHKKSEVRNFALAWGKVDSNHRTDSRTDLQSVAIATMRLPQTVKEQLLFFATAKVQLFSLPAAKTERFFSTFALLNLKDNEIRL